MYKMFRVVEKKEEFTSVCPECAELGVVDASCSVCGGNGLIHTKKKLFRVQDIEIFKIDRCPNDLFVTHMDNSTSRYDAGTLRYWAALKVFYMEPDKSIHFTYKDALEEARKRNTELHGHKFVKRFIE